MAFKDYRLVRSLNSEKILENFLLAAIVSFLGIRFFLKITGYPQLGGSNLHIAHLLWGGLLMVIALILSLVFLNRKTVQLSAVLGGFGFGAFIDELGKFITRDNNYFYQPTVAIVYVIFIIIYLLAQNIQKRGIADDEYLINALDMIKEAVLNDLDRNERQQALEYLKKCDPKNPVVKNLRQLLYKFNDLKPPEPNFWSHLRCSLTKLYLKIIQYKKFYKMVIYFFVLQSMFTLLQTFILIHAFKEFIFLIAITVLIIAILSFGKRFRPSGWQILFSIITPAVLIWLIWRALYKVDLPDLSFSEWGQVISSTAAATMVVFGIFVIYRSRQAAYKIFRSAVKVSIYLTQFFAFYREQFSALVALFINIVILLTLNFMINREHILTQKNNQA